MTNEELILQALKELKELRQEDKALLFEFKADVNRRFDEMNKQRKEDKEDLLRESGDYRQSR